MRGGIDAAGKVVAWDYAAWTASRGGRPGPRANLPAGVLLRLPENPLPKSSAPTPANRPNTVDNANSGPSYVSPSQRLRSKTGNHSPGRCAPHWIQNTWANASFMDALSYLAGRDPVGFGLAHLQEPRLIDVIRLAASMAGWEERPAASTIDPGCFKSGRGFAAMLYEGGNGDNPAVDTKTGKVKVDDVWSAQNYCDISRTGRGGQARPDRAGEARRAERDRLDARETLCPPF